jgi:hypothetical protein
LTVLRLNSSSYFLFISLILSKESFCSTFIRPSQDAGWGGNGGDAAPGGPGKEITVTYPAGYDVTKITTNNSGGDPGTPGDPGDVGTPGQPGELYNGGNAGDPACGNIGNTGRFGQPRKGPGLTENGALRGNPASKGDDGPTPSITEQGSGGGAGGGGGDFCIIYPSSCGNSPCINYYYVLYFSWDGGQTWEYVDSTFAGCW